MRPEIVADNVESDNGILQDNDDKYKEITDSSAAVYLEED